MQKQLEQLERDGYTVFPQFLDTNTTARIRAHMDSLLPPVAPAEEAGARRLHELRHPIPGAIMAELLDNPRLLEIASNLIEPRDPDDLRLLEQVLIRTDPQATSLGPTGPTGWHIDMAFLPEHYYTSPRQTYFHMVHCLNTVAPGGGAFTVVPGSHHQTFAAAEKLGESRLQELTAAPADMAGIDVSQAIEVCANEGDLLVFNPMALHSSSANGTAEPRYVYFASFFDSSAQYLASELERTNYNRTFPASLHDDLPSDLRSLLS